MITDSAPGAVGDYAACIGTTGFDYAVPPTGSNTPDALLPPTGAFVRAPGLRATDFADGLSNTLLIGEKHIPREGYLSYPHDCNLYDGHNIICSTRTAGPGFPIAQGPDDPRVVYGGPHIGVCLFVFADGGVRPVRKSIDEFTLGLLSDRGDGLPVPGDY